LTSKFLEYLESEISPDPKTDILPTDSLELLKYYAFEYRGVLLLLAMVSIEIPEIFAYEKWEQNFCDFFIKVGFGNMNLIYKK
jgi:hypothetical protein